MREPGKAEFINGIASPAPSGALAARSRGKARGFDTEAPGLLKWLVSSGGVPERSKGADCKSAGSAFEGSNPSPSTIRDAEVA